MVVICMSLLYYMFQSILNTFGLGYFFGGKKFIIFTEFSAKGGEGVPPIHENNQFFADILDVGMVGGG